MPKKRVMLSIDTAELRAALAGKETFSELAQKYGVSKQAVNGWLDTARIPPRALVEIARDLDLSPEQIDNILCRGDETSTAKKKWTLKVTLEEN